MDKMFTQAVVEKGSFNDNDRSLVAWASSPILDRDGEVIAHDAWRVENYTKNPVILWAHNYNMPPVAKAIWTKQQKNGLKFKPQFAPTDMGKELYLLYREGYLNAFSVGFDPKDYEEDEDRTYQVIGWFGEKIDIPVRTWIDVDLLEISCVDVPSCTGALVERAKNGDIKTKGLAKAILDLASKTVIPYKKYPIDKEGTWDGPAERAEADVGDLKKMCTWYDSEDADVKSSYKLPHHRADGFTTVWRGVTAAMGALLGARGGVDIPDSDRRGVYRHLNRHYGDFDEEAPEFKHYAEEELKAIEGNVETIIVAGSKVEGTWEAEEIEEKDPIERMREDGLAREKDGIVPVSIELWNAIMDNTKLITAQLPRQDDFEAVPAKVTPCCRSRHYHSVLADGVPKGVVRCELCEKIMDFEALIYENDSNLVEYTDQEFSMLVQQELKIREQQDQIEELSNKFAKVNGQLRVLRGGIG
jgi:HK97 family phage prohead protease